MKTAQEVAETITLKLKKFRLVSEVPYDLYKVQIAGDMQCLIGLTQSLTIGVERMVAGKDLGNQVVRVPRDWWEHFKERWFPAWVLRRWPVEYTTHTFTGWHLYPTLDLRDHKATRYVQIH